MSLAETLWRKYAIKSPLPTSSRVMAKDDFEAAITEAMQAVRKRDAELCRGKIDEEWPNDDISIMASDCAAAIEREPLP